MIPVPETILSELCLQSGIQPQSLEYLGGGRRDSDGIVYEYSHPTGKRVLKIIAIPNDQPEGFLAFRERLKFIHYLGEHDVDIVFPIKNQAGDLFTTCQSGETSFLAYVMNKVEGIHANGAPFDMDFVRKYGATIGKLHQISKQYPTWQHSAIDGKNIMGWEQEWQGFYQWARDPRLKERWQSIRTRLEKLPVSRDCFGFTHNDPHIQNLVICRDRLVLLDFDVANYHWFINDVAITLQAIMFKNTGGLDRPVTDIDPLIKFLATFVRGYRIENDLPDFWLEQIDLFINYRRLLLYTVMQDWLNKTAKYRSSWRKMIFQEPPIFNR